VPKRHCTSRAEWRLQPGKPAEPLSAHYRLDCDYGTPVETCWQDGGSEPIYACETHAKQLGRSRASSSDVRVIPAQSDLSDNPIKNEDRTQIQEAAEPKPIGFVAPQAARTPVEAATATVVEPKPNGSASSQAARTSVETASPEVADAKPNDSPPSETVRTLAETKAAAAVADPPVRSPARDLTFGNSARAMVDEVIWNMATGNYQVYRTALQQGKSATEAAQAAGGQLAVIHRKISEYTLKLQAVLSDSKATINVEAAIDKPLEQAMLEVISNGAMTDLEKDAAIQQLGTLQEGLKQGLQGNITPLQANQIILTVGDRLNWGGASDVSEKIKAVYRALYGSLKTSILTAVPEAQNLLDRLTNLYAAKSELEIC